MSNNEFISTTFQGNTSERLPIITISIYIYISLKFPIYQCNII